MIDIDSKRPQNLKMVNQSSKMESNNIKIEETREIWETAT